MIDDLMQFSSLITTEASELAYRVALCDPMLEPDFFLKVFVSWDFPAE